MTRVTKTFCRITKKGGLARIVREHYLRDDLSCGVAGCSLCSQKNISLLDATPREMDIDSGDEESINESRNQPRHTFFSLSPDLPIIYVVDTNIVLYQWDVLQHKEVKNVVFLQTVLDEVKHQNGSLYRKIRENIANASPILDSKHFYVFLNEFHRETWVKRRPEESINDRNDRAIRASVAWYQKHHKSQIRVVLVSEDKGNRDFAKESGIETFSMLQFVESFAKSAPELAEMISLAGTADEDQKQYAAITEDTKKAVQYESYLPGSSLENGLKTGKYVRGNLAISPYNALEASIFGNRGETILIQGRAHLNRAIHGDSVVVQVLDESQWVRTGQEVIVADETVESLDDSTVPGLKADNDVEMTSSQASAGTPAQASSLIPTAKVVGVIKRNWRPYCGSLDVKSIRDQGGWQSVLFNPLDKRIPKIRIRTRQAKELASARILVAVDSWASDSRYPSGHFVRRLEGSTGDRSTEVEAILLEHDVPFEPFTGNVLACLPNANWSADTCEVEPHRKDFRQILDTLCSIDPPGCTDIDDALHCRWLPDRGLWEVGVHIADVSHFVKPETAIDREAAYRSTTVYLVDRRIDMLPGLLGTNLCSLRSDVDRYAFSVIWLMNDNGEIIETSFTKSIIRSRMSFTYEAAQKRIDDPSAQDPLTLGIRQLNVLAKILRARRFEAGALTLASPEVRFKLEHDSQDPIDVELKQLQETNALVEEFMLLANISVAEKIYQRFPDSALLRRHPRPNPDSFGGLQRTLTRLGFDLDVSSSKALAESLDKITSSSEPYLNTLARIMTTRCMMQAVYACSGVLNYADYYHYGLATEIYTHFTSPIRRYPDVIVHRLLAMALNIPGGSDNEDETLLKLLDKSYLDSLCSNMNHRHHMAQLAARNSVEFFTHLFFRDNGKNGILAREEAYIIKMVKNGFAAIVPKYGIEGLIFLGEGGGGPETSSSTDAEDSFTAVPKDWKLSFDSDSNCIVSAVNPSYKLEIFQKILVSLKPIEEKDAQASLSRRQLKFSLIWPSPL